MHLYDIQYTYYDNYNKKLNCHHRVLYKNQKQLEKDLKLIKAFDITIKEVNKNATNS